MGWHRFKGDVLAIPAQLQGDPILFHVVIEKANDGWIVAEYPALSGCMSQGKDEQEAIENIKQAITAWLWA